MKSHVPVTKDEFARRVADCADAYFRAGKQAYIAAKIAALQGTPVSEAHSARVRTAQEIAVSLCVAFNELYDIWESHYIVRR